MKRPLIVTDRGLAALPLVAQISAGLTAAGLTPSIYAGVWGNPSGAQVMHGAAAYRAHEDLIAVGAYKPGADRMVDAAIALRGEMNAYLRQTPGESADFAQVKATLAALARKTEARMAAGVAA